MFNIICNVINKDDCGLGKYNSILEVKFWRFDTEGRGIKKFYQQEDHYEVIIDPDKYVGDVLLEGELPNNIGGFSIRKTWKRIE